MPRQTLEQIITEAINDLAEHGFDSTDRLTEWERRISEAIAMTIGSPGEVNEQFRRQMRDIFDRIVGGGIGSAHPGVSRFTLQNVAGRLHGELDRRIMASANLIRLNREAAIQKTLQRFSGWASSVPVGGAAEINRRELKAEIARPMRQLPFIERRVLIDQGHKLNASISATIASDNGAIAFTWRSRWRQANYNYREDHKERDGQVYLIRNSWAHKQGLVKPGLAGYSDTISQPAEEIYCRCTAQYLYSLRFIPEEMLTKKGKEAISKVRV